MNKKNYAVAILVILGLGLTLNILAHSGSAPAAKSNIILDPHSTGYPNPVMLSSPATFSVNLSNKNAVAYDTRILLVMTKACYDGLSGPITVTWDGGGLSFDKDIDIELLDYVGPPDQYDPMKVPTDTSDQYNAKALADHLGVVNEDLYYVNGSFLDEITGDGQEFIVTLPSSSPRMLVYVLGSNEDGIEVYNMSTPMSQPGFVVPELPLGTISGLVSMFSALMLKYRKRS